MRSSSENDIRLAGSEPCSGTARASLAVTLQPTTLIHRPGAIHDARIASITLPSYVTFITDKFSNFYHSALHSISYTMSAESCMFRNYN